MPFNPSAFNPEAFLAGTSIDSPTEKREALPVHNTASSDGCYHATVKETKARVWEGKTEKTMGMAGVALDITFEADVPTEVQAKHGLPPKLTLRDSVMLDMTDGGLIDNAKGKNGRLRMYRDALDMNKPGDSFSFLKMVGRPLKIKIEHETYNDAPVERVKAVLRPF